jgi:hypothetical protein
MRQMQVCPYLAAIFLQSSILTLVATGGLGGQVQNLSLTLGVAAARPGQPNQQVTFSFRTQTRLANTNQITITWPTSYLAPSLGQTPAVVFSAANTFSAVTVTATNAVITVGTATAPSGSYTITLTGLTIGGQNFQSQRCNSFAAMGINGCISAVTTTDRAAFASYPSIQPRGQVTAVGVDVLQSDRVPGSSRPVTISFTTQTDLSSGQVITM